jgi:hypothetical protein
MHLLRAGPRSDVGPKQKLPFLHLFLGHSRRSRTSRIVASWCCMKMFAPRIAASGIILFTHALERNLEAVPASIKTGSVEIVFEAFGC